MGFPLQPSFASDTKNFLGSILNSRCHAQCSLGTIVICHGPLALLSLLGIPCQTCLEAKRSIIDVLSAHPHLAPSFLSEHACLDSRAHDRSQSSMLCMRLLHAESRCLAQGPIGVGLRVHRELDADDPPGSAGTGGVRS